MVVSSPLIANVLPIINLPVALGNLPIAANGLPLVPIGNDVRVVGRFHWWSLYLRMLGSTVKNYCPASLLSVVSKNFEKLVNNKIVDHLEKCGLFSDFQYSFRSSRLTADLLTVLSDS